ncbi:hypothetical protein I79_013614 [Cricetulus griseus]|uniref:Uncharacterized protein n=1 Tax=Cricetulus griseus TaxID=10029 RepID=G3HRY9_CRIGR|nr:hypothetical protein I79_013614 [Cricetulus griseus]
MAKPRQTSAITVTLIHGLNIHARWCHIQVTDSGTIPLLDSEIWLGGVHHCGISQHSKASMVRELGQ